MPRQAAAAPPQQQHVEHIIGSSTLLSGRAHMNRRLNPDPDLQPGGMELATYKTYGWTSRTPLMAAHWHERSWEARAQVDVVRDVFVFALLPTSSLRDAPRRGDSRVGTPMRMSGPGSRAQAAGGYNRRCRAHRRKDAWHAVGFSQ